MLVLEAGKKERRKRERRSSSGIGDHLKIDRILFTTDAVRVGVDAPNIAESRRRRVASLRREKKERPVRSSSCKFGNRIAMSCTPASLPLRLFLSLPSLSLDRLSLCAPFGRCCGGSRDEYALRVREDERYVLRPLSE